MVENLLYKLDPIAVGLGPDTNPYRYCANFPLMLTDPTGLFPPGDGNIRLAGVRLTRGRVIAGLSGAAAVGTTVAFALVLSRAQQSALRIRVRNAVRTGAYQNLRNPDIPLLNPARAGIFTVTGDEATGIAQSAGLDCAGIQNEFRDDNPALRNLRFQWRVVIDYRVRNIRAQETDVNFGIPIEMVVTGTQNGRNFEKTKGSGVFSLDRRPAIGSRKQKRKQKGTFSIL